MKREGRASSGKGVNLSGVAEFFFDCGRRSGLNELSEARAGIGESPGRQLNFEFIERVADFFDGFIVHRNISIQASGYRMRKSIWFVWRTSDVTNEAVDKRSAHFATADANTPVDEVERSSSAAS